MSELLTQRLPILVSPTELKAWKERADRDGISTSEFIRKAAAVALVMVRDTPVHTEAELDGLATTLAGATGVIRDDLTRASKKIDAVLEQIAAQRVAGSKP